MPFDPLTRPPDRSRDRVTLDAITPGSCTEQLREQRRSLATSRFPVPRELVVTCIEGAVEPVVTRLAPCLRLRTPGLALDAGLREAIAIARTELQVSVVIVVVHTRCDHREDRAAPLRPARPELDRARLGHYERMRSAAARAGQRFADAREHLRARLLALRDDACLVGPDGRRAACFGVLHVAESGATHLYAPDSDCFALVG